MSRRKQFAVLGLAVLGALAAIAFARYASPMGRQGSDPTDAPSVPQGTFKPTSAQWAALHLEPVLTRTFQTERVTDGKIALNGDRTTQVFSPYSGRVTRVLANVGDRVRQGDALLEVEATEFVQAQNDLIAALNSLATARSQLALATGNEQRKHALLDSKGGSLQDWEQSRNDLVAAENNVRTAEAALAAVRNRLRILGKTQEQIDAIARAGKVDAVTPLLAPISGTITDRQVGVGQFLQAGAANPAYVVGDLSTVWLVGNVRESDAPLMRRGLPVEVRVLALPDKVFKARIATVAPSVDPNTRRLAVRAEVDNAEGLLKPEMFASFSVMTGTAASSPAVPQSALVHEGDAVRVWVQQGDLVASRPVQTGRSRDGMVEVIAGLAPGDKVVTKGTLFIDRAGRAD